MGCIDQILPDLLAHSNLEVVDVAGVQINDFVMNLVVTLSRNLDLHREVLQFDSFDAARNKPKTRSFANYSCVDINPAYSKHERVGTIFEGEVFDCESINAVGVNLFEFDGVNVQETLLLVVYFEGFVLENLVSCERCG